MRREIVTAAALASAAIILGGCGIAGFGMNPGERPSTRYDEWDPLPSIEDVAAWGWVATLVVLAVVPITQHVAVLVAWRCRFVAARRSVALRIENEAPLLEDYMPGGAEIRIGRQPGLAALESRVGA